MKLLPYLLILNNLYYSFSSVCWGDNSCVGTEACIDICEDDSSSVGIDSCIGTMTCFNAGACADHSSCVGEEFGGSVNIGNEACTQDRACNQVGSHGGNITIGSNACIDANSCEFAGQRGHGTIGDNACHGTSTCFSIGSYGKGTVGMGSCVGDYACFKTGAESEKFVTIGEGSCLGRSSCKLMGYGTTGNNLNTAVTIGDGSCVEKSACYRVGCNSIHCPNNIEHNIVIGSDACKCESCCTCLSGNVIVSDGHCNARGTDTDQCCTTDGVMNESYQPTPDTTPVYTLPVYDLGSPTCSTSGIGTNEILDVTCSYNVTIPDALNETSVRSEVHSSSGCDGDAPDSVSRGAKTLSDNKNVYQITINIAVSGDNSVLFCLRTVVTDDEGNEMKYNSQILETKYDYTADFNLTLDAKEFEGLNDTAADLGSVEFEVEVFRCDSEKSPVSPSALKISEDLYICIRSKTVEMIIATIDEFTIEKNNANKQSYKAVENGESDYNTYVKDEGVSRVVVVGTRPQAFLFVDDTEILIRGKATLGTGGTGRYLARFTQETNNEGALSNFEMEVEVVKASSNGNIASIVSALIGIVAGGAFIFF